MIYLNGASGLLKRVQKMETQIAVNKSRAARAAANALKRAMKEEAPKGKHDSSKRGIGHLRQSISVRAILGGFTVGPRSPLAHLVIRGTKQRHEEVAVHDRAALKERRELRFHARGFAGPGFGESHALMWKSGGESIFRAQSNPGPMPANAFVHRTRLLAEGEARQIAKEVLLHDALDPNQGA